MKKRWHWLPPGCRDSGSNPFAQFRAKGAETWQLKRIFEDLLGGSLRREDVPGRVKVYIAELNKLYPTQYRKFGDSLLVSLDEVLFEDGSTTRGDTVSRGLWD